MSNWLRVPYDPSPPAGHFAPVPKTAEREFTYRLQNATPSALADEKLFTLRRWRGAPNVYGLAHIGSGPSEEIYGNTDWQRDVNMLAVNARAASNHWLFSGYERAITSIDSVTGPPINGGQAPVIAIVIQTTDADSNGDGKFDDQDRQSVYIYRPGDAVATKLVEAGHILSGDQIGATSYLVVYERGASATAAIYSVPDFKLVSQAPLRNVPR